MESPVLPVFHRFQLIHPYRDGGCLVKIAYALVANNPGFNTMSVKRWLLHSPPLVIWRLHQITWKAHCIWEMCDKHPWLWPPLYWQFCFLPSSWCQGTVGPSVPSPEGGIQPPSSFWGFWISLCLGLPAFPKSLSSLPVISLSSSQQTSNLRKLCIVANQQRALNLIAFSLNGLLIHHIILFSAYLSLRHPVPPTWWHLLHPQCCVKLGHFEWPFIGACSSKVTQCDPLILYLIKTY